MSTLHPGLEQRLVRLEAESIIRAQCHRYCRALDRVDEDLLRSVFHPDSTHEHGAFKGTSAEFCNYAMATVRALDWTQHFLSNVSIEIQGDAARVESYFLAFHRLNQGRPGSGVFHAHDLRQHEDVVIGGRYLDRFEYREGEWKIAHRQGINEWESWTSVDPRCATLPKLRNPVFPSNLTQMFSGE